MKKTSEDDHVHIRTTEKVKARITEDDAIVKINAYNLSLMLDMLYFGNTAEAVTVMLSLKKYDTGGGE